MSLLADAWIFSHYDLNRSVVCWSCACFAHQNNKLRDVDAGGQYARVTPCVFSGPAWNAVKYGKYLRWAELQ